MTMRGFSDMCELCTEYSTPSMEKYASTVDDVFRTAMRESCNPARRSRQGPSEALAVCCWAPHWFGSAAQPAGLPLLCLTGRVGPITLEPTTRLPAERSEAGWRSGAEPTLSKAICNKYVVENQFADTKRCFTYENRVEILGKMGLLRHDSQ